MNQKTSLEDLLDTLPELNPSASLQRRVFEIPLRAGQAGENGALSWLLGYPWRLAVSGLGLVVLGAVSGWGSGLAVDPTLESDVAAVQAEATALQAEAALEEAEWQALSEEALALHSLEDWP